MIYQLLAAVAGKVLADEFKAWLNWLHKRLRSIAVRKLPAECRNRYDEEWESVILEIPGDMLKVLYTIGLIRASIGIRKAYDQEAGRRRTPRIVDLAVSSLGILVLAPTYVAIAIAIRLETGGPVFRAVNRVGKSGRTYRCLKFRTVINDTELRFATGTDGVTRMVIPPRRTSVGRFLYLYSLDELPQLLSVFRGEMNLTDVSWPSFTMRSVDKL